MFIERIKSNVLLKPLQTIVGIVERKQPLPILSNVLIEKQGNRLTFFSTDLEIQIATELTIVELDTTTTSITVAARKLLEIIKVLPENSDISVEVKDGRINLKTNKSRFSLQTLPASDFPKVNEQLAQSEIVEIEQQVLKRLFNMVQFSMAQQDIRYYLNGVLLVIDGEYIKLIATDGHRLAYSKAKVDRVSAKKEVILPRKTVNELVKLLDESDNKISINIGETQLKTKFSDITLISKLIDGKFPDYEKVVPKYSNHLNLDRVMTLQALQRVAILSNEKFRGVRFVLTERNLRIISSNSEQEEAQEEIEVEYHGPALDIGFNVNYLLDGLNSTNSETVTFSFGDPNSSILITIPGNDDFMYVVMPMRI